MTITTFESKHHDKNDSWEQEHEKVVDKQNQQPIQNPDQDTAISSHTDEINSNNKKTYADLDVELCKDLLTGLRKRDNNGPPYSFQDFYKVYTNYNNNLSSPTDRNIKLTEHLFFDELVSHNLIKPYSRDMKMFEVV